jgi:hypothetical protein
MMTTEAHMASPRPVVVASLIFAIALGVCWMNYPCMMFGTSQLSQSLWIGGLGLAAAGALMLLITVHRYAWLTLRGRFSPALLITSVGVCSGFIALTHRYFSFLERMP